MQDVSLLRTKAAFTNCTRVDSLDLAEHHTEFKVAFDMDISEKEQGRYLLLAKQLIRLWSIRRNEVGKNAFELKVLLQYVFVTWHHALNTSKNMSFDDDFITLPDDRTKEFFISILSPNLSKIFLKCSLYSLMSLNA